MFRVHKRNVSLRRLFYAPKRLFVRKITDDNHFGGYRFFDTTISFELLIIRNKTSSGAKFEFARFDCTYLNVVVFFCGGV